MIFHHKIITIKTGEVWEGGGVGEGVCGGVGGWSGWGWGLYTTKETSEDIIAERNHHLERIQIRDTPAVGGEREKVCNVKPTRRCMCMA